MEAELSLDHEIDHNPKPEDARTIKICVSVQGFGETIDPTLSFVIPYVSFEAVQYSHSHELAHLTHWMCSLGFTYRYICDVCSDLTDLVFALISSVSSRVCAVTVYMTSKIISFPEEAIQASFDETTNDVIQESFDETTDDVLSRPASKLAVDSLSRRIYKNNEKKTSNDSDDRDAIMCTICMEEFKEGEMVVTLSCGHEFDDCCIVEWFATRHDCPLCRFQLPRES
ncbi:hypothetical protein CARUB_v10010863mg [Capsella rubella]|uniref:RING-type domain-containing protein n=1 Tax=Capsella rubella TaxID=81985 RepID=R0GS11_9BRAS|nr:probable E3 ubiquitin-protein ligase plr-1 [Capsella rubella]EOA38727.1 hypothetical protein CARUB_v10010863mg [Capsella rubella]